MRRLVMIGAALMTACSGGTSVDDIDDAAPFQALPIAANRIACIEPLGVPRYPGAVLGAVMSRWDVLPSVGCAAPTVAEGPIEIVAAGKGTVVAASGGAMGQVTIAINDNLEYTYRGVALDGFIVPGTRVDAGQRLGLLANADSGLAFGVTDYAHVNEWLNAARYPDPWRHAVHPFPRFTAALQNTIDARWRSGLRTGRLVWDAAGNIGGNWFATGVPQTAQAVTPAYWAGHLAFRTDTRRVTATPLVTFGDLLGDGCICAVAAPDPAFTAVTVGSGPAAFHLQLTAAEGVPVPGVVGTLLIEMLEANRLRAEWFPGDVAQPAFTAAAVEFFR